MPAAGHGGEHDHPQVVIQSRAGQVRPSGAAVLIRAFLRAHRVEVSQKISSGGNKRAPKGENADPIVPGHGACDRAGTGARPSIGRTASRPTSGGIRIPGTNTCRVIQRVGNAGRNILRSDGIGRIDLSLVKSVRITENQNFQFRAGAY